MDVRARIKAFVDFRGLTVAAFEGRCGLSNGAVSKMGDCTRKTTFDKISNAYPELNITWARTGEGEMLRPPQTERRGHLPAEAANVQRNYNSPGATMFATNVHTELNNDGRSQSARPIQAAGDDVRPLVPMSLYKQQDTDVYEQIVDNRPAGIEQVPYFAGFPDYQMYMEVQDEAMLPDFKVGDRLALSALPKDTYILNGNIYAIDTRKHGLFIRILVDRDADYECQSTNNQARYVTFRVPKTDVLRLYRVMGLIRTCI